MAERAYLVITPCRDEAEHVNATIRSVATQTIPPATWVIVDDGSTDETPSILEAAARLHPFIRIVRSRSRGGRRVGPGVVEAFRAGLETVDLEAYEYVCKLDADLEVPPTYFERMIQEMESDPCLGSISGKVYLRGKRGGLTHERRGDEAAVGPAKFYRVACFRDIGGFVSSYGWDAIDAHMCRVHAWIARSIDDPSVRLVHRRGWGSSESHVLRGRYRDGLGRWFIGTSPLYFAASVVYRTAEAPYLIGAAAMAAGYLHAMLTRRPRFGDASYRSSLRSLERAVLLHGKRRALQQSDVIIRETRRMQSSARRSRV